MKIIDSHLHLLKKKNFNSEIWKEHNVDLFEDTPLDDLVGWLKEAGVIRAVVMGQDMTRIWKSTFGEDYLLESIKKYPDFFVGLASLEPMDVYNRFNKKALEYFEKAIVDYGFKGIFLAPPYSQYYSNDKVVYPFYQKALELDALVQFHHSAQSGPTVYAPTKYADMFRLNDVIFDFPDLKIVVEHLGYPWTEHLLILMVNDKNLWTDLAMMYDWPMKTTWSLVLAKEYGVIDRVMYASDFCCAGKTFSQNPAGDMKRFINFVEKGLNKICQKCGWPLFSEEEIEGILWKNANRLYNFV